LRPISEWCAIEVCDGHAVDRQRIVYGIVVIAANLACGIKQRCDIGNNPFVELDHVAPGEHSTIASC